MPKDTIYLYVDGFDLEESEATLTVAFIKLANEWHNTSLCLVNDRDAPGCNDQPGDLPEWLLGLNIKADTLNAEHIDSLLRFATDLAVLTGHEFVFGLADQQNHTSEDICFIDAKAGEAERLKMLTALSKH